jgi:hypothetical protein
MAIMVIGFLAGAALALRFNVLILFPTIGLALLGEAAVGIANRDRIASVVLTMILLAFALQIGFLALIAARALVPSKRVSNADVPMTLSFAPDQHFLSLIKSLDVQDHMEVVGSDGKHVGAVDHKESADGIMLTKDDPNAGGRPHIISIRCVDYVDDRVHLNKPAKKAMAGWKVAA